MKYIVLLAMLVTLMGCERVDTPTDGIIEIDNQTTAGRPVEVICGDNVWRGFAKTSQGKFVIKTVSGRLFHHIGDNCVILSRFPD